MSSVSSTGYYIAAALGVDETDGIDWIRWIISIAVAVVAVIVAATLTGRRSRRPVTADGEQVAGHDHWTAPKWR